MRRRLVNTYGWWVEFTRSSDIVVYMVLHAICSRSIIVHDSALFHRYACCFSIEGTIIPKLAYALAKTAHDASFDQDVSEVQKVRHPRKIAAHRHSDLDRFNALASVKTANVECGFII